MYKKAFSILLFLMLTGRLYAQGTRYLSLELAGSGGLASLNMEKTILTQGKADVNWRLGFGLTPIDRNNGTVLTFPVMVHTVIGAASHRLDLGLGQSLSVTTRGAAFLRMPLSAGYRLEPKERRYYLRIAYTPIVSYLLGLQWEHWAGISFGLKLKNKG